MKKKVAEFPYTLDPEQIPTQKNWDVTRAAYDGGPCVNYACPDNCWQSHHSAWCKLYRENKTAPQPMPFGHCMFADPVSYGMVPYGCTDQAMIRAAWEANVRGLLSGGWDRDLSNEQLDTIVNATVKAKMQGADLGGAPFIACITANL